MDSNPQATPTYPTVDVCGKRTLEYVAACLSKFNRGASEVHLRSIGGNVSKGMDVARILEKHFQVEIGPIGVHRVKIFEIETSCLEMTLRCPDATRSHDRANRAANLYREEYPFIDFSVYQLLLDALLATKGELRVAKRDGTPLIRITPSDWDMRCKAEPTPLDPKNKTSPIDPYYRSGFFLSPIWHDIAKRLAQFDDIIIGIDTGILHNAVLSEQLLNALSLIEPNAYVHTPNWLLLVVPSTVMHELEQAANRRNRGGYLIFQGRMGFRALQEIMDLDQASDLMGVSLVIVGQAVPMLEARVELRGLREDFAKRYEHAEEGSVGRNDSRDALLPSPKLSSGDMMIRDQFKQFLRQIDFHKGIFFLTADKTNAALASTEGLHAIYYKKPSKRDIMTRDGLPLELEPPLIPGTPPQGRYTVAVPLGKLIYEFAVQFGTLKISWDEDEIELQCDGKGESLFFWVSRSLRILKHDLKKLSSIYKQVGKFSLGHVKEVWEELSDELIGAG